MGKKLPSKLRDYPKHLFKQWGERFIPPRNDDVPLECVWSIHDPQPATDAFGQPSTEQATADAPACDLPTDEDDGNQDGSSADSIPPLPEQRTERAALIPPPNFHANSIPTTPSDRAPYPLTPTSLPATTPYSLLAASSHLPHVTLDASASRYHPYRPPRPRHASWPPTPSEETHASTSYGRNSSRGTSEVPRTQVRNAEVRSTSPVYPRFSVDPSTGWYYWSGTMDPAALDELAAPAEPSRLRTTLPPAHRLPQEVAQPLPFGYPYPPALPQDTPFYGQNGAAGLFHPQDDAMTADRQALYHPGNARPQWGTSEAQDWNPSLPHGPVAGPSTNEDPMEALGPLDAPLLPGFSALGHWPFQPQDGSTSPPYGSQEQ